MLGSDLMTSKPDYVSTLGYHWTDHTGRPLEPQVHWDATGTTLADACTQWCPCGDPVLICIIGTHWKTTGKPLEDHWNTTGSTFIQWHSNGTGIYPVAFQCTLGSKFQAHWIATGLPLEDHWLRVRGMTQSKLKILDSDYITTSELLKPKHQMSFLRFLLWFIVVVKLALQSVVMWFNLTNSREITELCPM